MLGFDIFLVVSLNKQLIKQSNCELRRHDTHVTSHIWWILTSGGLRVSGIPRQAVRSWARLLRFGNIRLLRTPCVTWWRSHGSQGPVSIPEKSFRKVSKLRDLYLESSDRSEIWQALRQQCCRCACQISKRYDNLKYQSRGFETLRDLTKRRLFGYWDGAQVITVSISWCGHDMDTLSAWLTLCKMTGGLHRASDAVLWCFLCC